MNTLSEKLGINSHREDEDMPWGCWFVIIAAIIGIILYIL